MGSVTLNSIIVFLASTLLLGVSGCKEKSGIVNELPGPAPAITGISPDSGKFGTVVTISGANFSLKAEKNIVTFNGMEAAVKEAGETKLVAEVPQGAGTGSVAVTVAGQTASGPEFTYLPDNARFVNGSTGTDTGNNCNDVQNPCATIGYVIEESDPDDLIFIAAGAYTESLVLDKSITLQGAGENTTFIQAHEEPEMAGTRVMLILKGHDISIRDVTVRHGKLTGSCNSSGSDGGGISNAGSTVRLTHIIFNRNRACRGGGMSNSSGAVAELNNVTFSGNSAQLSGGGMANSRSSSPVLTGVTFSGNSAEGTSRVDGGGGMYSVGIGSKPTLTDVTFEGNTALGGGGGLYVSSGGGTLKNVHFLDNIANQWGGGMFVQESSPTLTNVIFHDNTSNRGGGMYNWIDSAPLLINVTFNVNSASVDGGAMRNAERSAPRLFNSIVWGNSAGSAGNEIANHSEASVGLYYSIFREESDDDIEVGEALFTQNSLSDDPGFVDMGSGNLRLQAGSPAINAGNPGTDLSMFTTDGSGNPIDLDGNPRVVGGRIDIGAYENQGN